MRFSILSGLLLAAQLVVAQTNQSFWKPANPHQISNVSGKVRPYSPTQFSTYSLDFQGIKSALKTAPMEFTAAAKLSPLVVELPVEGRMEQFAVWQSPIYEDGLAARWPDLRTFAAQGVANKKLTARLDFTLNGFHAIILEAGGGIFYIEPVTTCGQTELYWAFDRKNLPQNPDLADGALPMVDAGNQNLQPISPIKKGGKGGFGTENLWLNDTVTLRRYRLAITATTEYSEAFDGTKATALSEVMTSVNVLTAIWERDLDIRFILPTKEDTIVFSVAEQDPFGSGTTNNDVGYLLGNNNTVVNPRIGKTNYDVGHVFTRFTGGSALGVGALGVICDNQSKANGSSSAGTPSGDYFNAVAGQEIGHQFDGNHTFNYAGGNENGSTAYEPYAGSTIMSYSTWGPDLYYHNISIEEIGNFSVSPQGGNSCAVKLFNGNHIPTVEVPLGNKVYIPYGTPFDLTAVGSDVDAGDQLTYCWEEYDLGPTTPDLNAATGTCPIFRTFYPTVSPTRIFPKMDKILANNIPANQGEVLPAYARAMTFRCTVRDNAPNGGGVAYKEIDFNVANTGPFRVVKPNAASDKWTVGDFVEVKWETAGSEKSPINCQKVNIELSTDGGQTWPIMLVQNVPNDGSQFITVPNNLTTKARVRIHAADNIFFDVSNANFKIEQPATPGWALAVGPNSGQICLPASFFTTVETAGWLGFSQNIDLDILSGLPPGAIASFNQTSLSPGANASLSIDFQGVTQEGNWEIILRGKTASGDSLLRSLYFTTVSNNFSSLALVSLPDGSLGTTILPTLTWNGAMDANSYDFELAKSPSFDAASLVAPTLNLTALQTTPSATLDYKTLYYWRVRPRNECGIFDWTEPFVFGTEVLNCQQADATDLPKNISFSGTATVESTISVPFNATITDINVTKLEGFHEFLKDLYVSLVSPTGKTDTLFYKNCGNYNGNISLGFDDQSPKPFQCPPNDGAKHRPKQPLSTFVGDNAQGDWKLVVQDLVAGSGGQIKKFGLEFCGSVALEPPFIVKNIPLEIDPGQHADIADTLLKTADNNNTDAQLDFTLVVKPKFGHLSLNGGGPMEIGTHFTQADINNGSLQYFDWGGPTDEKFVFVVSDGEGGFIPKTTFLIKKTNVAANEPIANSPSQFTLAPNPTTDLTALTFDKPTDSETQLSVWNTNGQLVFSEKISAGTVSKSISTESWPEGLYLISVRTERGLLTKKLLVSR